MDNPWRQAAEQLRWEGPLSGYRVLITRPRGQNSQLADGLNRLGASTLLLPVIEVVPPSSFAALDTAIAELPTYDWLLLTSANAAEAVAARLPAGSTISRLAVIGAATLARVRELALPEPSLAPVLLPPQAISESLADTLEPLLRSLILQQGSARVLLPRADHARELLPLRLRAIGAEVTVAAAYRNQLPGESLPLLRDLLTHPEHRPHAIPFTSSSSVSNLLSLLEACTRELPPNIARISIGPITSATLRAHGLPPHAEATHPTVDALIEAVMEAATLRNRR